MGHCVSKSKPHSTTEESSTPSHDPYEFTEDEIVFKSTEKQTPDVKVAKPLERCGAIKRKYGETSRDARNKAEKQRRDKLNRSISELSNLVPLVTESARKIDKTGVLRLTAHELRKEYVFGDSMYTCEREFSPGLINAFIEMLDGCLITTTCKGIIVVISANVEKYLGHCQTDLLGTNLLNLCHPDDIEILKINLMPHVVSLGSRGQLLPNTLTAQEFAQQEKQRSFHVRLARAVPRSEPPCYNPCKIIGHLRRADKVCALVNPLVRRQRQRNEEATTTSGNDVVFIGIIHPLRKDQLQQRLFEASKEEYKTRHLTDGRIVSCDQRVSMVAGYLTSEINGVSAFTFMHKDDVRWVIIALRQMYDSNKQYGESYYRLITKSGEFIYMKSTGYLEIGSHNDVQSFICLNTRLSEKDGKFHIAKMKSKYEVIFDGLKDLVIESNGEETIEDPVKLEQAIVHLITDLPSANTFGDESKGEKILCIITPQLSTVKSSIEKSFSVLGKAINTQAKNVNSMKENSDTASTTESIASKIQAVEELPSNTYLVDVIQNMDLFNEKKDANDSQTYFNDPLSQLVDEENSNKSTNSPKVYRTIPLHLDESKLPMNNETANILNEEVNLPSTSSAAHNNQTGNLYTYEVSNSTFGVHSFSFIKSDNTKVEMENAHSIVKPVTNQNGDPLIGSINHDELDKFVEFGSFGAQKRSMIDDGDSVMSKRKAQATMNQSPDMIHVCDTMFPTSFTDNISEHITRNSDTMPEGFDQFIDELTDPTSDLGVVVPRSLVALETSITDIDDTVTQITPTIYPAETDNYSDIMDHHSQNKNILENIQNEHKTTAGGKTIEKDSNDEF